MQADGSKARVFEIDTTKLTPKETADKMEEIIKGRGIIRCPAVRIGRGDRQMVLDGHRDKADFALTPVAKKLINVNPNMISWVGLILALLCGILLLSYDYHILLIIGALVVLISGYFDALDEGSETCRKGLEVRDFLDHVFDRYADVFNIGGVALSAWVQSDSGCAGTCRGSSYFIHGDTGSGCRCPAPLRRTSRKGGQGRSQHTVLDNTVCDDHPGTQLHNSIGDNSDMVGDHGIYFAVVGNLTAIQRAIVTWNKHEGNVIIPSSPSRLVLAR